MDGVLLVFDSRTLPNVHALATVSAPMPEKGRRSRMVPAFATLILMLVIASVYYVTTLRSNAADNISPASVTSVSTEPAVDQPAQQPALPVETPAAVPEPTPDSTQPAPDTEKRETRPTTNPKPAAVPAKKATAQPAAVRSPEPKKDESKVGSILKKTGKILKKPFKF
jgi:outer membrane biosynthesis protein TonB